MASSRSTASQPPSVQLKVSAYDQVSSMLVAALIMVGLFVALLLVVWWTSRILYTKPSLPVELARYGGGGNEGLEQELEEPGLEEMPELEQPQFEATLEAVTDVVTSQQASFAQIESNAANTSGGSNETDAKLFTVIPTGSPSGPIVVTIVIPVANIPQALRNSFVSNVLMIFLFAFSIK